MAEESLENRKVILRFVDGKMLKGYIRDLKITDEYLYLEDESGNRHKVRLKELKAIFYVKRFEGLRAHQEKKPDTDAAPGVRRVFVKFKDGETIMGKIDGEPPWQRGAFRETMKERAFTVIPLDADGNNTRIVVVTTAVQDVAMTGM